MSIPIFYTGDTDLSTSLITLNEESAKHIVQVLRMQVGEQVHLTDGKGQLLKAEITDAHKRNCTVRVKDTVFTAAPKRKVSIAISLVKNASRFEWFLEKVTELGVSEIIPLLCERTERQHFRYDRMQGILVSAMLQSQQTWLPVLHTPIKFDNYIQQAAITAGLKKYIAHCVETDRQSLAQQPAQATDQTSILIGPEGDFSITEIELALAHQFIPVTLGETRLRTETAGVTAAVLLCIQ